MQRIKSLLVLLIGKTTFFVGFLLFIVFAGLFIYLQDYYQIRSVKVLGTSKDSRVIRGLDIFEHENIFMISEDESKIFLKEANPYIKDLVIQKRYPDTIEIKVSYFSPLANLQVKDGYFLLSENGVILEKNRELQHKNLPLMKYYQNIPFTNYQAGQEIIFKDIQDSLYFLSILRSLKVPVNSIDIAGFHMLGLYTETEQYYFSSERDISKQEYQLKQAIQQLTLSGRKYKTMDLRFDKPVVTF